MTPRQFWQSLSRAMRDGTRQFYAESPTHRWLPIYNEVMLAQRAFSTRRYRLEWGNNGGPLQNPFKQENPEAVKAMRKELKRRRRAWLKPVQRVFSQSILCFGSS